MTCIDMNTAGVAREGREARPRILFVAQHLPVPVRGGSSQRSHLLIEALRSFADVDILAFGYPGVRKLLEDHGYSVAAVLPLDRESGPVAKARRVLGFLFPLRFRYRPREDAARLLDGYRQEGRYDAIVGRYCRPSARAGVHRMHPAIMDIDDLESQKLSSWFESHHLARHAGPLGRWLVRRVQSAERQVIAALDSAWLSAAEDLDGLPARRLAIVPNIPFYPAADLPPSSSDGAVLFVASFDYRVNADALRRFVEHVWPRVRAQRPDLRLRVIGGGLEGTRPPAGSGVDHAGFVDDLTAEYAGALCSVVPIWEGGGSKIKVLESLALGRACVVAAPSIRGYGEHLRDGDHALVAADEDALVAHILRLASDPQLRHRLEQSGRTAVNTHFSRANLAARVRASVESTLGAHP